MVELTPIAIYYIPGEQIELAVAWAEIAAILFRVLFGVLIALVMVQSIIQCVKEIEEGLKR